MNFFQRTIRYLTRKPSKTILLMITFFVIGNLVILGLGVSQASDNAKILTRKKMRAAVSYEVDVNAYWSYTDTISDQDEYQAALRNTPKVSKDIALDIKNDSRVIAFNYYISNNMYSIGFESVPVGNEEMRTQDGTELYGPDGATSTNVQVLGNLVPDMIELEDGTFTIKEGRFFNQNDIDTDNHICLITKELSEQNNLRLGDSITVAASGPSDRKTYRSNGASEDEITLELEIIGIYDTKENVDPNSPSFRYLSPSESPKNSIITSFNVLEEYLLEETERRYNAHPDWYRSTTIEQMKASYTSPSRVVYLLDDPLHVDAFVNDNQGKCKEYTKLNANNETFKKMARPLDTMSFFANIVVWIVVVNAVVIISLVTALTLKTREFEIGVMLSMGVSKPVVVLQLFLELMLIAVVGFSFASVTGSLAAGRVGDMVLDFQTSTDAQYGEQEDNTYSWGRQDSYFTEVTQDDLFSEYHVSVSPALIAEIFVLGAGVVLIATLIPSLMIMRLNPKQILLQ